MKQPSPLSRSLIAAACFATIGAVGGLAANDSQAQPAPAATATRTTADGRELSLIKVGETRITRTEFEYLFKVVVKNNGAAMVNGTATLTAVGAGSTVVRSSIPLGAAAAGATVSPFETIVIRHDRTLPFDVNAMNWSITDAAATQATIPREIAAAAAKIAADPQITALIQEQSTPTAAKARWNQFLELVRIPSPSHYEYLKSAEIHRRALNEWGFAASEVPTRNDGFLVGSDTNIVDGQPVYNACLIIKGSYAGKVDSQQYNGQYPKVLVDGHIDVVNPESLPPASDPWNHLRLQPYSQPIVETPEQLSAISREIAFDSTGRVVEDANYATASQWFTNATTAQAGGGVRIYVPGYGDMMSSTSNMFALATAMKKYKIKPVYDIWLCGSAGEEGKGNLVGMKQLFGFDQALGTGSNPLNFVAYFGNEGSGVNFTGSYRFEMKYNAPASPGPMRPNPVEAMAASIAKIADVKTPSELRPGVARTTYTVGRSSCEPLPANSLVVPSCSIEVDMRSDRVEPLNEIRAVIEPTFQAGVSAENARFGRADGSPEAVGLELVWYGLRPAYVAPTVNNPVVHAGLQSAIATGLSTTTTVSTSSGSLNDNVPANTGVPTWDLGLSSSASGGGGHAFWEWGTRGNPATEVTRMHRALVAMLIASGFNAADGTVIPPQLGPIGSRTREANR